MKRILTLDGGGVRGIYALQILAKIESHLRNLRQRDTLVLADEFDFFAGTSTGALIAAGLCWGMSVKELETFYMNQGALLFKRAFWTNRWKAKYRQDFISQFFRELFSEDDPQKTPALLGSAKLQKLLLIVTRNASTGAPWPVTNNPRAMYNLHHLSDCNLNIPLWQLLRASTAAPGYFPPQEIQIGDRVDLFLDGGVTNYNNPSMISFLTATLPQYQLNWPTGREKIHLISIGTGKIKTRMTQRFARRINMIHQLGHFVPAILGSTVENQDMMCRVLGDCLYGDALDSEIGDLQQTGIIPRQEMLFSYVRYNQPLDQHHINVLTEAQIRLDNVEVMPLLRELGREYAENHVKPEHLFPRQF